MNSASEAVLRRNNVKISGSGERTMMFAHGFGCDQTMWDAVSREFEQGFRIVLFDYVGHGRSDLAAYSGEHYSTLSSFAEDVVEIGQALDLHDAIFVGHSVSAMIGAIATLKAPDMFSELVMVGPSPRYVDDHDYRGGFSKEQIQELLEFLGDNYLGWSAAMAPAIMGNSDRPELGARLENSFCSTDPEIARDFARVTFLADNRDDLALVNVRTLILQCTDDIIAPVEVGRYVHAKIKDSEYRLLNATGHCPHLSAPDEVTAAIRSFV
ncbi:alpha/beta fold hydrolase [Sphingomicrobium flavum]|uniref:alpha/beta fold hydrolase n=1 Tax=Sphingomicrobium flavum TaxID=1229164 RepID=UPI0021AD71FC|nr:alpha/beta hydrolase [Sphingomicrobium flavum]